MSTLNWLLSNFCVLIFVIKLRPYRNQYFGWYPTIMHFTHMHGLIKIVLNIFLCINL